MGVDFYSFSVRNAAGIAQALAEYQGKVVVVVNVASRCGFTAQYAALQAIYSKYKDQGLVILGFPCNQFGKQEQGSDAEIQSFCKLNYGVEFPVFGKIEVNGAGADPLYNWLKSGAPGVFGTLAVKWNFCKFLLSREGKVLARFAPATKPEKMLKAIEEALAINAK